LAGMAVLSLRIYDGCIGPTPGSPSAQMHPSW
jgi:hypothetical protein